MNLHSLVWAPVWMMFPVVGAKEHLNESMFSSGIGGMDCILHDEFEMQMSFMSIIIKLCLEI